MRGRLALAAVCVIAATVGLGWLFWGDAPTLLGEFEADGIVYRSIEPGAALELFSSGRCLSGNSFIVPEAVQLTVRLAASERLAAPARGRVGAILTVTGPAELTLEATSRASGSFSALLASGRLKAEVRPRHVTDEPFVIRTPEAVVVVVGTGFVVDATVEGVTRLEVSHGEVEFRALHAPVGQAGLRVTAETGVRVIRRGDRRPGLPPPSPPPVTATTDGPSDRPTDRPDVDESSGASDAIATSEPDGTSDPDGDANRVDTSVPVESPIGDASSSDGPTLGGSAGSVDLDQVVNPHRDEKEEP